MSYMPPFAINSIMFLKPHSNNVFVFKVCVCVCVRVMGEKSQMIYYMISPAPIHSSAKDLKIIIFFCLRQLLNLSKLLC